MAVEVSEPEFVLRVGDGAGDGRFTFFHFKFGPQISSGFLLEVAPLVKQSAPALSEGSSVGLWVDVPAGVVVDVTACCSVEPPEVLVCA